MRLNENTIIAGDKVVLVPYRAEHVPTYHGWMKSPELLELTASEPLSFEEELEMQQKWHLDEDKLTFILLARPSPSSASSSSLSSSSTPLGSTNPSSSPGASSSLTQADLAKYRMIGDVNLFLPDGLDGDGECEIMIASKEDRRHGHAIEALSLFLKYLTTTLPLPPSSLIARIGASNVPSIQLFRKLGFGLVKHVKVFDEVEMRFGAAAAGGSGKEQDAVEGEIEGLVRTLGLGEVGRVDWESVDLEGRVGKYDE